MVQLSARYAKICFRFSENFSFLVSVFGFDIESFDIESFDIETWPQYSYFGAKF